MGTKDPIDADAILLVISRDEKWLTPVDALSLCRVTCPGEGWASEPLLYELVFSMLLWESTIENAVKMMAKIQSQFVDFNELRVCFPHEIDAMLGSRYQRAEERSVRLIQSLHAVFNAYQSMTLEPLRELGKREAREALVAMDSLPRFVVSRVLLLGLEAHALPMDAKIARALHKAELIKSSKNPDDLAARFERSIRANQSLETYTRLERWLVAVESGS